uniref:Sulfotransferase domain-containing protein n=1 Tax=viral metagenome TaxID=1070528 RepID=A0A6C0KIY1_9ZZZZ
MNQNLNSPFKELLYKKYLHTIGNHTKIRHDFDVMICTPGHCGTTFMETNLMKQGIKTYGTHLLIDLLYTLEQSNKTIITIMKDPISRNFSKFYTEIMYGQKTGEKEAFHHHRMYNYYGPSCREVLSLNKEQINDLYDFQYFHFFPLFWMQNFLKIVDIDLNKINKEKGITIFELKNNNKLIILTCENLSNNKKEILKELNLKENDYNNIAVKKSDKNSPLWKKLSKDITYSREFIDKNLNHDVMHLLYTKDQIKKLYEKYI